MLQCIRMVEAYEVALRNSNDLDVRPVEAAAMSGKFLVTAESVVTEVHQ